MIAVRTGQELRLRGMRRLNRWPRLAKLIRVWWSDARVRDYVESRKEHLCLIAADAPAALRGATTSGVADGDAVLVGARKLRDRRFGLLGVEIPSEGSWLWHMDWREAHEWPPRHYRDYDFYEKRERPYDVKVPWELSRLGFLSPLLQAEALESGDWANQVLAIVEDWEHHNPLAHTIGWYPLEASVRSVALVCVLEMLLALGETRSHRIAPLLRLIAAHGEFVWRTIEDTDVRSNHYVANIVALLLDGLALRDGYPSADRWIAYAVKTIPREIALQLLPDGVGYEKSLAYHKFVTELFLVAFLSMKRAGIPMPAEAAQRIYAACRYSATCTRPDGLTPNIGDNDGARVLTFDWVDPRDHRPLIGLAAVLFDDGMLKTIAGRAPVALPWLLGASGVDRWERLPPEDLSSGAVHFDIGGVVVIRDRDNYLWCDVGEVGLAGRGGHGHNDLFSFELVLGGVPLVVDPGSPMYSADFDTHNQFRSTAYHNTLRVDGEELARMTGWWWIRNDAVPFDVEVGRDGPFTTIRATHAGYGRLPDPVIHTRELRFSATSGVLSCHDHLRCRERHRIERFFRLAPSVTAVTRSSEARLMAKGRIWRLFWDGSSAARIEEGWVSPGYGVTEPSSVLVLRDTIDGKSSLRWSIEPLSVDS